MLSGDSFTKQQITPGFYPQIAHEILTRDAQVINIGSLNDLCNFFIYNIFHNYHNIADDIAAVAYRLLFRQPSSELDSSFFKSSPLSDFQRFVSSFSIPLR